MRRLRWLQPAVLALAACGGVTRIDRQRVAADPAPVTALALVSEVGDHGELDGAAFERAVVRSAAACGLQVAVAPPPGPRAAAVLAVTWAGTTKDLRGSVRSSRYRATLVEPPARELWGADLAMTVDARGSTERWAEAMAHDLLAALRRDRLTPPCPRP